MDLKYLTIEWNSNNVQIKTNFMSIQLIEFTVNHMRVSILQAGRINMNFLMGQPIDLSSPAELKAHCNILAAIQHLRQGVYLAETTLLAREFNSRLRLAGKDITHLPMQLHPFQVPQQCRYECYVN
jgi:hypothetical protein